MTKKSVPVKKVEGKKKAEKSKSGSPKQPTPVQGDTTPQKSIKLGIEDPIGLGGDRT